MSSQDNGDTKVNWVNVKKWVEREGLKTNWKAFGTPDIINESR